MTKNAKLFYVATLTNPAPLIYIWKPVNTYIEPIKNTSRFNLSCYHFANADITQTITYCDNKNKELDTLYKSNKPLYIEHVYSFFA